MQKIIRAMKKEVSKERLYQTLALVCGHHRIQTTQGYRDAAHQCAELLRKFDIQAQVLSYEMKEKTFAGSYRLFPQWNCHAGWCRVIAPKELKLADYQEDPIQIITQSIPCDYRKEPLEIVDMCHGSREEDYADIDLKGKLLFTHEQVKKYLWAIERKGAVGIISDYINETDFFRDPIDLPDIRNYTGFWWDYAGEKKAFGFVISPRLSRQLKELCRLAKEQYEKGESDTPYPKAQAYVDAVIEEGHIEVVEAVLPGKSPETILMTAHLCHPYASANDNASGVSGGIETLIALKKAVEEGAIEPLEKSVRLILIPEFTGTYHYLNDGRDLSQYTLGINLDMIGARQEGITGPITLTHLPYAMPSIAGEAASLLMEEIKQDPENQEDILLQNVLIKEDEFTLGSDHFILSDPQIDIPCVMIGQMPDLYYHTSGDTLQRMDLNVLKYSTVLAASYVYLLSNMNPEDAQAVYEHQCTHLMKQQEQKKRKARLAHKSSKQLQKELAVLKEFHLACARDMLHYVGEIDVQAQCARIEALLPYELQEETRSTKVYRRCFHDPIEKLRSLFLEDHDKTALIDAYEKRHADMDQRMLCEVLCVYYIDGKRNIDSIIDHVEGESGVSCRELLLDYISLLESCGLIEQI